MRLIPSSAFKAVASWELTDHQRRIVVLFADMEPPFRLRKSDAAAMGIEPADAAEAIRGLIRLSILKADADGLRFVGDESGSIRSRLIPFLSDRIGEDAAEVVAEAAEEWIGQGATVELVKGQLFDICERVKDPGRIVKYASADIHRVLHPSEREASTPPPSPPVVTVSPEELRRRAERRAHWRSKFAAQSR